jgi:hypothetical protein
MTFSLWLCPIRMKFGSEISDKNYWMIVSFYENQYIKDEV